MKLNRAQENGHVLQTTEQGQRPVPQTGIALPTFYMHYTTIQPLNAPAVWSSETAGTDKISIQCNYVTSSHTEKIKIRSTATIRIDSLRMQLINKMAHLQITSLDDAAT